jgi:hypothetical protein
MNDSEPTVAHNYGRISPEGRPSPSEPASPRPFLGVCHALAPEAVTECVGSGHQPQISSYILVNPVRPGRRVLGGGGQARLDETSGTRTLQHSASCRPRQAGSRFLPAWRQISLRKFNGAMVNREALRARQMVIASTYGRASFGGSEFLSSAAGEWSAFPPSWTFSRNKSSGPHRGYAVFDRHTTAAPASKGLGFILASRRETCTADHLPPRAAGMPRASSPSAMARNDSQPAARSSLTVVDRSEARPRAIAALAALPARRASPLSLTPTAKLHASPLGRGESRLRALRDHLGFVLGHGRHDVDGEPVGLRKIDRLELDAGLHQVRDKGHIAGQPVELSGVSSLRGVAKALSARGVKTARGGEWTAVQVSDILRRA